MGPYYSKDRIYFGTEQTSFFLAHLKLPQKRDTVYLYYIPK
jgi:hypothetical protein